MDKKKMHMEEIKATYNCVSEKVKHVYFNSFGNSMNAILLQVINWLQDI